MKNVTTMTHSKASKQLSGGGVRSFPKKTIVIALKAIGYIHTNETIGEWRIVEHHNTTYLEFNILQK